MTAPGNSALLISLLAVFVACTGYAVGRLHQRYRTGRVRDEAYRDGYDTATRSVFSLAARVIGPRRPERAAIRASASVRPSPSPLDSRVPLASPADSSSGRHTVPDELVRGATYRLAPDRVARARVREAVAAPDPPAAHVAGLADR
jgi:hypothetical protein